MHGLDGIYLHQPTPNDFEFLRFYSDGQGCGRSIWGSKNPNKTVEPVVASLGRQHLTDPAALFDYQLVDGRLELWKRHAGLTCHVVGEVDARGRLVVDFHHRGVRVRSGVMFERIAAGEPDAGPTLASGSLDRGEPAASLRELVLEIFRGDAFFQPLDLDERTFEHHSTSSTHSYLRQTREHALLGWNLMRQGVQHTRPRMREALGDELVDALIAMMSSVSDEQLDALTPERPVLRFAYEGLSRWWGFDSVVVMHPSAAQFRQVKNDAVLPLVTYLVAPCYACEFGSTMTMEQARARKVDVCWSDSAREPHPALSLVSYAPPTRAPKKLKARKPYNTKKTPIGPRWAGKWWELENAWGRVIRLADMTLVELDPQSAATLEPTREAADWNDVAALVDDFLRRDRF
ncbi:MAG: hypothetical protein H6722_27540 [Sandaracinus sp.]|nr:hypothetical protein [Myxococcales bacterium]MCB9616206.1 hypothetical protein [Sandaracinus sp.]